MFSAVIRPGGTPTGSVDLVAYLARYEATATSVTSPSSVSLTTRGSTWAPHVMSQPFGLTEWATVANHTAAAAAWMRSATTSAVKMGGGGMTRSGWTGSWPSRRKMAWKWTWPRRWNSAALAYDSRGTGTSWVLASLARRRRMAMVVRRHNSDAWTFQ